MQTTKHSSAHYPALHHSWMVGGKSRGFGVESTLVKGPKETPGEKIDPSTGHHPTPQREPEEMRHTTNLPY